MVGTDCSSIFDRERRTLSEESTCVIRCERNSCIADVYEIRLEMGGRISEFDHHVEEVLCGGYLVDYGEDA